VSRTINVSETARKTIQKLSKQAAERTLKAVYSQLVAGIGDVRHLVGKPNRWRLRVGDYRVIIEITADRITVMRVAHRREAFREKKTLS
jgi:mRNA interferase RelE/StbE